MSIFFDHSESSARIVGGFQAGSVPHMVALIKGGIRSLHGGGSRISNRHILTAAHCIRGAMSGGSLSRSLRGSVGSNRWNSGGFLFSFARHIVHPNYIPTFIKNDIGILVTSNSVAMSKAIRVVRLSYDFVGGNVPVQVNGWGRIRTGGAVSETLLEPRANTVEGNSCVEQVRRRGQEINLNAPAVHLHIEICIFADASKGTCHGDSGSALVHQNNGHQVGVVSWCVPCARGTPDIIARVGAYQSWIQNIIG